MNDLNIDALVNKDNRLDLNYVPSDLVEFDNNENNFHGFLDPNTRVTVSNKILLPFRKLEEASISDGLHISIDSGYRSASYQESVFNRFLAKYTNDIKKIYPTLSDEELYILAYKKTCERVVLPGCSEHQTGYAFDIACYKNGVFSSSTSDEERGWMKENSYRFGFILRYPKGKEEITGFNFEPWHFRYVGNDLAYRLYNDGNYITLEEYHKAYTLIKK